jgi:hypothetical protein
MLRAKDNPFAVDRIRQIRYEPPEESWESLLARLAAMNYRGAIVGPCGSGKTTLCEEVRARLQQQGLQTQHLFVSMDIHMRWRNIQRVLALPFDVVLVDGADHLFWWIWRRLKRRIFSEKRGLIVTTHQPGLLPTWHECHTSPVLLKRIVNHLVPDQVIPHARIQEFYNHCQGNIRDALRELYDLVGIDGLLMKSHLEMTKLQHSPELVVGKAEDSPWTRSGLPKVKTLSEPVVKANR